MVHSYTSSITIHRPVLLNADVQTRVDDLSEEQEDITYIAYLVTTGLID